MKTQQEIAAGGAEGFQGILLMSLNHQNRRRALTDEEINQIAGQNQPVVPAEKLASLFHLVFPTYKLPQFTRRLRTYKAERGL
jgi:hypothetical protein